LSPERGLTAPWSGKAEGERRGLADAEAGEAGKGLSNSETGVVEGMEVSVDGLEEIVGSML
jgi:hypothetical protein